MSQYAEKLLSFPACVVAFMCREFRTVLRDEGILIFFFLVPLLYPLLYGLIYNTETLRRVPVVVVDESASAAGRHFVRRFQASPDVSVVARAADMQEARRLMGRHKAYATLRLPSDFEERLARGGQAVVAVYADMSGMLYYKAALMAATQASLGMNGRIKVERAPGTTDEEARITAAPIGYEEVSLFNPQAGYAAFLVPAVLVLIVQQTLLLGVGMAAGTECENRRAAIRKKRKEGLPPAPERGIRNALAAVGGKALCYFLLYIPVCVWVLALVPKIFGYVRLASLPATMAFMVPFVMASVLLSLTLSHFVRERETSMLLFVFTSVPFLFLSGISWPWASIPEVWRGVAHLLPSTFGVNAYVRITTMGADVHRVAPLIGWLWLQAAVYGVLAVWLYARREKMFGKMAKEPRHRRRR